MCETKKINKEEKKNYALLLLDDNGNVIDVQSWKPFSDLQERWFRERRMYVNNDDWEDDWI